MKKYLSLLALMGTLFLVGCDCTDDSCGAGKSTMATDQLAGEGAVITDVVVDQMGAELGQKTHVYFDTDKSAIKSEAVPALQDQAEWMKSHPGTAVVVAGHCDERGTREYNLGLGERRANAIKARLVSMGVEAGRITTVSYGKDKPLVLGTGPQVWAQNRVGITAQV